MDQNLRFLPVETPEPVERMQFTDAAAAVQQLVTLYDRAAGFLLDRFMAVLQGEQPRARYRAFYPELRLTTTSHSKTDSRLSFGHVGHRLVAGFGIDYFQLLAANGYELRPFGFAHRIGQPAKLRNLLRANTRQLCGLPDQSFGSTGPFWRFS